jgi:hypothetical protein
LIIKFCPARFSSAWRDVAAERCVNVAFLCMHACMHAMYACILKYESVCILQ